MLRNHKNQIELTGDFSYLKDKDIYLDTACQSLRPLRVQRKLEAYYKTYNACGERARYPWAQRVDEEVAQTREETLKVLGYSKKDYEVSFTLNTTYGLNLILGGIPRGRFAQVATTEKEHNSVFLPTQALAQRWNVPRIVLTLNKGEVNYDASKLKNTLLVISAVSNIDGEKKLNLQKLIKDIHSGGGLVVVDAAQAFAHERAFLKTLDPDALAFSAHKAYGASLGVVVIKKDLLESLTPLILGGGQVSEVHENSFTLIPDEPYTKLEPGLQAWGEIIAFREALAYMEEEKPELVVHSLAKKLYEGLSSIPTLDLLGDPTSGVMSFWTPKVDGHRLNTFLARGGIMARSGFFCAHYYLLDVKKMPPLIRFSLGGHLNSSQIDKTVQLVDKLVRGL